MRIRDILFSLQGRLDIWTFWVWYVAIIAIIIGLTFGIHALGLSNVFILLLIAAVPSFIVLALTAKRLHDRGKSAWILVPIYILPMLAEKFHDYFDRPGRTSVESWIILIASVAFGVWIAIEVCFIPGERKTNAYGPPP